MSLVIGLVFVAASGVTTHHGVANDHNLALLVGVFFAFLVILVVVYRQRKRNERADAQKKKLRFDAIVPDQRLDTVVVAVAVRGAAGRALLDQMAGSGRQTPAAQLTALVSALQERRSSWASAVWFDDEPVPAEDAPARIHLPLDRLEAALPESQAEAPSYRGGPDGSVVIAAFGGISAQITNAGDNGLDDLLPLLAEPRPWHHVRILCRGPIEAEQVDSLPLAFRPV